MAENIITTIMNKKNQLSFLRIAMAILLLFSVSMNFYFVFLDDVQSSSTFNNTSSGEHHGPPLQLSAPRRGVGASFNFNKDKKRVGRRIHNTVEKIIGLDDDSIQLHIIPVDQSSTSTADQIDVKDMSNEELWSRIKAPPKPDGWETYSFRKIRHHFKCKGKPLVSLWLYGFA